MMIEKDSIKPLAILLTQKEVKYWKLVTQETKSRKPKNGHKL